MPKINRLNVALDCIAKRLKKIPDNVVSVTVYGSLIRGDFIDGRSDVDFFIVFKRVDEKLVKGVVEEVKKLLLGCMRECGLKGELDLAWLFEDELKDPLNKGYPFKFLTVYQDDFRRHHATLYGPDPCIVLPRYPKPRIYHWRAERLRRLAEKYRDDRRMLKIVVGEAVRLYALVNGAKSISNQDVLSVIRMLDQEAAQIWTAYLEGLELRKTNAELIEMVKRLTRKVECSISTE